MQKFLHVVLFSLFLALWIIPAKSQEYRITNYGIREGINYPFVYTINQDKNGFIWIGTGEGLCRFSGFSFSTDNTPDSLKGEIAGISYKDSQGNLWFGYYNGSVVEFDGHRFTTIHPGFEIKSAISGIAELSDGIILVSTLNNGLFAYNTKTQKATATKGLEQGTMVTSIFIKRNTLLVGTQDGLAIYSVNSNGAAISKKVVVKELEYSKVQDIEPSYAANTYWIATEDKGVARLVLNGGEYSFSKTGSEFKIENENVQAVFEDAQKQLWVSTLQKGILKLGKPGTNGTFGTITSYNKNTGLAGDAIKKVFKDVEGNIWVATYGDGITLLSVQALSFTGFTNTGLNNDIRSIAVTNDNIYFIGGPAGLFKFKPGTDKTPAKVAGVPSEQVTALHLDGDKLFIGTETKGLFVLDTKSSMAKTIPYEAYSMGYWINSIATDAKKIYLGTKDGIYRIDKGLDKIEHYTTNEGLPYNNIECVFVDSKGRLLYATRSNGIYSLDPKGESSNFYPARDGEVEFKSVTEDEKGAIWAASYGDGVFCFRNDSVYQLLVPNGLKANFCYSIVRGVNRSIWVGHRLGMSRINGANMRISSYDQNVGVMGDCNPNAVFRDKSNILYFGTTNGLFTYDPAKDKQKKIPPFTNIMNLWISDKAYDFTKDIVLPYNVYKLRIEFIGLNYSDPQSVRYQYKLEGNDLSWSDVSAQDFAVYPRLEDGDYTFYVRSFNSEGISQETPISIHIRVKPPIWKTWWFLTLSLIAVIALVYLIIKYRERKQRELQEYLERELKARTKEVVEQKEVIEIKNKDITDSINYAKRIQTSMLPPIKRLQQHFSGSFVFYSPRDIVSGDFYWFDQVNDNKFTIVCADSTGHGVPGAFMSMIGSTLIKDICTREARNSPSRVLEVLDTELRNTLNQNLEDGTKPGDGMDIIVCEIDLKTHYVRYASAMRPMIIYRNAEEVFVKGSRNSVGGHYEREVNIFEDEGIQLSEGDIIYMFSDGYSDQFGGPMGKKFKMVRLKSLLQDIHMKPMDEQYLHIKNTFNLWKENYDQVDDVLFMGIKI
jgi:ligand-binding sensor domain-containing protein/serine phosphatase RsbU (regulator of sigma subunit)